MNEPPVWTEFLRHWRELRMDALNEQGTREEFVAPFLRMLGYAGGTIAGILYEHSEPLPPAFRKDRQPAIRPDYILTYRLERFWVMEIKRPGTIDEETFRQAQFYAVHPKIRARYMVIADGLHIRVYDAWAMSFDDPLIVVERDCAEQTFSTLYKLLAAREILGVIRRDVVKDIERTLAVEIDERAPDEILAAVSGAMTRARPLIQKNIQQLRVEFYRNQSSRREAMLKALDWRGLLWMIDRPTEVFPNRSDEIYSRIAEAAPQEREQIAREVLRLGDGICRVSVRYHVLRVLLLAAESQLDGLPFDARDQAIRFARENLDYRTDNALANAALHLENACNRVAMKVVLFGLTSKAIAATQAATTTMALEDLLVAPPNAAIPLIASGSQLAVVLRNALLCPDLPTVVRRLRSLERVEREYLGEKLPERPGDQLLLHEHGYGFDLLIRATQDVLSQTNARRPGLLPEDLAAAGEEFLSATMRPSPPTPAGDEEDEQVSNQLIAAVTSALGKRA